MKREYVGFIFMLATVIIIIGAGYIFEEAKIEDSISKFIIIWLLIAYNIGQYSMRFPKKFGE